MTQDGSNPELNEYPSVFWKKFFDQFGQIDIIPVKEWKILHLLSYFSKRYQDHYGVKFSFRFNSNSPSKSYEIFQMRKIGQIISTNPEILKDYIDYFFETKIILKKKRITSLAFLSDIKNCNEYKFKKLLMDRTQNIDRTTVLPANILRLAEELKIECKTYGDLAFLHKMMLSNDVIGNETIFINRIVQSGFDISILGKVK